jgi:hypothetical protein
VLVACGGTVDPAPAADASDAGADAVVLPDVVAEASPPSDDGTERPRPPGDGVLASGRAPVLALAADGDVVFWVERAEGDAAPALVRTGLDGGEVELVAVGETFALEPWDLVSVLALSGGAAAWTWPGEDDVRVVLEDGGASVVATVPGLHALALGGGFVWWTSQPEDVVRRVALAGGEPEVFAEVPFPTGLAVDAENVFVIARLDATLLRVPIGGGDPEPVATWPGDNTMRLFAGPAHLVWSNHANGDLLVFPKPDGPMTVLAEDAATSGDVAVGATLVWSVPDPFFPRDPDAGNPVLVRPLDGSGETEVAFEAGEDCRPRLAASGDVIVLAGCDGTVRSLEP